MQPPPGGNGRIMVCVRDSAVGKVPAPGPESDDVLPYREPIPPRNWWLPVLAAFLLLYLPFLGTRELQTSEALLVAASRQAPGWAGWMMPARSGGELGASIMPLCAWPVQAAEGLGLPVEWAVRLPAVAAVLALAGLCGVMAARAGGHLAGAVAAACCLATLGMLREGRWGAPTAAPIAFLISGAWFLWYRFGRIRKNWGLAWVAGTGLTLAAFFVAGPVVFVWFYLPLVFLRRPLRIWPRFWVWPHLVMMAVAAVLVWAWLWVGGGEGGRNAVGIPAWLPWPGAAGTGFFQHLVTYPFRCAWMLLPWALLAWPGFCVAFRRVERTPIFCRYLRTLVLVPWLAGWLLPWISPEALLPALGPLAVLTGLHTEILLRRHHDALHRLIPVPAWIAISVGTLLLLLLTLHGTGLGEFAGLTPGASSGVAAAAVGAMVLGGMVLRWQKQRPPAPYWSRLLWGMTAAALAVQAFHPVYRSLFSDRRAATAADLAGGVPVGVCIYDLNEFALPVETVYLDRPVLRLQSPAELPARAPVVYVLAGAKPPILETRQWEAAGVTVDARQKYRAVWRWFPEPGRIFRVERQPAPLNGAAGTVRLHRGTLKPSAEQIFPVVPAPSVPPASL